MGAGVLRDELRDEIHARDALIGAKTTKSRRRSFTSAVLTVTALLGTAPAGAESGYGWLDLDPRVRPPGASASGLAFDEARRELILFGGVGAESYLDTWVRRDGEWLDLELEAEPPDRYGGSMVYDAARGEVVLFGGYGTNPDGGPSLALGDTWTWDGLNWSRVEPIISPTPRAFAAMAYDRARKEVVLFGGIGIDDDGQPYTQLGDTWTWDGAGWTREEPPASPPRRNGAGMAFDEARGEIVLFGGDGVGTPNQCTLRPMNICIDLDGEGGSSGDLNDTWTWDGEAWAERSPAHSPGVRMNAAVAYDAARERVVLFSGVNVGGLFHDTWVWDGEDWSEVTPQGQPEARFSPAAAFDRSIDRLVLFGGHRITYYGADTWGWDGTRWSSLEMPTPLPRIAGTMSYDPVRRAPILFGGIADPTFGDTWTHAGGWFSEPPQTAPPARSYAAMVTDTAAKEVVLFGGLSGEFENLGDTWVWDGSGWREETPSVPSLSPLPRQASAMAYDPARDEVVMFGGWNSDHDVLLNDTWTWDGASWELELAVTAPPPLRSHTMAYDDEREEVVLYGGIDDAGEIRGETWTWDGDGWTKEAPPTSPPPSAAGAIAYDPTVKRVLLFGGLGHDQTAVWTWDGSTWASVDVGPGPSRRSFSMMTFLPELEGSLLFGGLSAGYRDDTWLLRMPPVAAP